MQKTIGREIHKSLLARIATTIAPHLLLESISSLAQNLIQILDMMGRETTFKPNTPLIYVYDDGSTEGVSNRRLNSFPKFRKKLQK